MRKLISTVVLICFLLNAAIYDYAFALGPNLSIDDMMDGTSNEKVIQLCRMRLSMDLEAIDKLTDIDGATDIAVIKEAFRKSSRLNSPRAYREKPDIESAIIKAYFDEVAYLGGNFFVVPVSVESKGKRRDLRLVFSTTRASGSRFDTAFYDKNYFEANLDSILRSNTTSPASAPSRMAGAMSGSDARIEDAKIILALTGLTEKGPFTIRDGYIEEYERFCKNEIAFGFEPNISDDTVRADLRALRDSGYLIEDMQKKPFIYYLSARYADELEALRAGIQKLRQRIDTLPVAAMNKEFDRLYKQVLLSNALCDAGYITLPHNMRALEAIKREAVKINSSTLATTAQKFMEMRKQRMVQREPRNKAASGRIDGYLEKVNGIPIECSERAEEVRGELKNIADELRSIVETNGGLLVNPIAVGGFCETKQGERRSGIIPDVVRLLTSFGIKVFVESGTGVTGIEDGSRFADSQYAGAGARIERSAFAVLEEAGIVQHIKELQPAEYGMVGEGNIVYNFNHFGSAKKDPTRLLENIATGATFVSFENIRTKDGYPILKGPSQKAGVVAAYNMALYMSSWLRGGLDAAAVSSLKIKIDEALRTYDRTNIPPIPEINLNDKKVDVYGGGVVGYNQARILARMGAKVTVIEKNKDRRDWLWNAFNVRENLGIEVIDSENRTAIEQALGEADGISTTAYQQGMTAQHLISKEMLARIGSGKIFTVVDIDQGGGVEGVEATSHKDPYYVRDGNLFYAVANMPGAVPRQTSIDVSLGAAKYLVAMSLYGLEKAVSIYPELAYAVDVAGGRITNPLIDKEFPGIPAKLKMVTDRTKMTSLERTLADARARIDAAKPSSRIAGAMAENDAALSGDSDRRFIDSNESAFLRWIQAVLKKQDFDARDRFNIVYAGLSSQLRSEKLRAVLDRLKHLTGQPETALKAIKDLPWNDLAWQEFTEIDRGILRLAFVPTEKDRIAGTMVEDADDKYAAAIKNMMEVAALDKAGGETALERVIVLDRLVKLGLEKKRMISFLKDLASSDANIAVQILANWSLMANGIDADQRADFLRKGFVEREVFVQFNALALAALVDCGYAQNTTYIEDLKKLVIDQKYVGPLYWPIAASVLIEHGPYAKEAIQAISGAANNENGRAIVRISSSSILLEKGVDAERQLAFIEERVLGGEIIPPLRARAMAALAVHKSMRLPDTTASIELLGPDKSRVLAMLREAGIGTTIPENIRDEEACRVFEYSDKSATRRWQVIDGIESEIIVTPEGEGKVSFIQGGGGLLQSRGNKPRGAAKTGAVANEPEDRMARKHQYMVDLLSLEEGGGRLSNEASYILPHVYAALVLKGLLPLQDVKYLLDSSESSVVGVGYEALSMIMPELIKRGDSVNLAEFLALAKYPRQTDSNVKGRAQDIYGAICVQLASQGSVPDVSYFVDIVKKGHISPNYCADDQVKWLGKIYAAAIEAGLDPDYSIMTEENANLEHMAYSEIVALRAVYGAQAKKGIISCDELEMLGKSPDIRVSLAAADVLGGEYAKLALSGKMTAETLEGYLKSDDYAKKHASMIALPVLLASRVKSGEAVSLAAVEEAWKSDEVEKSEAIANASSSLFTQMVLGGRISIEELEERATHNYERLGGMYQASLLQAYIELVKAGKLSFTDLVARLERGDNSSWIGWTAAQAIGPVCEYLISKGELPDTGIVWQAFANIHKKSGGSDDFYMIQHLGPGLGSFYGKIIENDKLWHGYAKRYALWIKYNLPYNEEMLNEYLDAEDADTYIRSLLLQANGYVDEGFDPADARQRFMAFVSIRGRGIDLSWSEFRERIDELVKYDRAHPGSFTRLFGKTKDLPSIEFSAAGVNIMDASNVDTKLLGEHARTLGDIKDGIDDLSWMERDFAGSKVFNVRNLYYQVMKAKALEAGTIKQSDRFNVEFPPERLMREELCAIGNKEKVYRILFGLAADRLSDAALKDRCLKLLRDLTLAAAIEDHHLRSHLTSQNIEKVVYGYKTLYGDYINHLPDAAGFKLASMRDLKAQIDGFSAGVRAELEKVVVSKSTKPDTYQLIPQGFAGVFRGRAGIVDCSFDTGGNNPYARAMHEDTVYYYVYKDGRPKGYIGMMVTKLPDGRKVLAVDTIQSASLDGRELLLKLFATLGDLSHKLGCIGVALPGPGSIGPAFNFENEQTVLTMPEYRDAQKIKLVPVHESSWAEFKKDYGEDAYNSIEMGTYMLLKSTLAAEEASKPAVKTEAAGLEESVDVLAVTLAAIESEGKANKDVILCVDKSDANVSVPVAKAKFYARNRLLVYSGGIFRLSVETGPKKESSNRPQGASAENPRNELLGPDKSRVLAMLREAGKDTTIPEHIADEELCNVREYKDATGVKRWQVIDIIGTEIIVTEESPGKASFIQGGGGLLQSRGRTAKRRAEERKRTARRIAELAATGKQDEFENFVKGVSNGTVLESAATQITTELGADGAVYYVGVIASRLTSIRTGGNFREAVKTVATASVAVDVKSENGIIPQLSVNSAGYKAVLSAEGVLSLFSPSGMQLGTRNNCSQYKFDDDGMRISWTNRRGIRIKESLAAFISMPGSADHDRIAGAVSVEDEDVWPGKRYTRNKATLESFARSDEPAINPSLTSLVDLLRSGRKDEFLRMAVYAMQAGAKTLHLDIFDKNYVGTYNMDVFTPELVEEIVAATGLPVDVHLMVRPSTLNGKVGFEGYIKRFTDKGASFVSIHYGAFMQDALSEDDIKSTLAHIRSHETCPGLVFNPDEDISKLTLFEKDIDFALAMTVMPGAGGRGIEQSGLRNIEKLKASGFSKLLACDGAMTADTISRPFSSGVRWFVVGSYYFGKSGSYNSADAIARMQESLVEATKPGPVITVIGSIVADVIIHREEGSPYLAPKDPELACEGDKKFKTPPATSTDEYIGYARALEQTLPKSMREKYPIVHRYGGPALATAHILHQLGARVKLIGAIGDDALGHGLLDFMREKGMDTSGIQVIKGVPTSTNLIFEGSGGTAYNLAVGGANEYLRVEHVTDADLRASVVQLSGIALTPTLISKVSTLIYRARLARSLVGWDTVVDIYGMESTPEARAAMSSLDFMTPSMGEAPMISRQNSLEANVDYFINTLLVPAVFMKNGKDGMEVFTAARSIFGKYARFHMPVVKDTQVRGETGAGDAAVAGIVYEIAKGRSSRDAAVSGATCGSLACENREGKVTNIGDQPRSLFAVKRAKFEKQIQQDPQSITTARMAGAMSEDDLLASKAIAALPKEWGINGFNFEEFAWSLVGMTKQSLFLNEDSAMIFSESVTFAKGIGVLLPKIASSYRGRIAVIATTDRERALMNELNNGKPEDERIVVADDVADARSNIRAGRYYYFKIAGDPDTDLGGIMTLDITELVERIINLIGRVSGIAEKTQAAFELYQATRKFIEAAA